jgi:hypothetical protein
MLVDRNPEILFESLMEVLVQTVSKRDGQVGPYVTPSPCTHTPWNRGQVFGNDGVFNLGTKIILQQVEHGKALLLYTLMP